MNNSNTNSRNVPQQSVGKKNHTKRSSYQSKRNNNNNNSKQNASLLLHQNNKKTGSYRNHYYYIIIICFIGFTFLLYITIESFPTTNYNTSSSIGKTTTTTTTSLATTTASIRQTTTIIDTKPLIVDNDSSNANNNKLIDNNNKVRDDPIEDTADRKTSTIDTMLNNNKIYNNNNNNINKLDTPIGTISTAGSNSKVRYVKDVLCSGCRFSYSNSYNNITCIYEIQQLIIQNQNLNIIEAATIVASYNTNYCQRCHPYNGCNDNEKIYYRPDDVVAGSYIEYATTHFLQSIHIDDRVPNNVLMSEDIFKEFISNSNNILPNREYYFEFNPSIVQLPKNQIPIQLLIESGYNVNIDIDRYYIASYRVSTGYHCFKEPEEFMIRYLNGVRVKVMDYLGIAILDVNLNILLETVIDPKSSIYPTIPGVDTTYQDGRLFNFNNQLYLGSFTKLYPIWLINPPSSDTNNDYQLNIVLMPHYMKSKKKLNKVWTDNEEKYNQLHVYINQKAYCSNDSKQQRFAKSLNYFYDINTNTNNHIVMELFPMGPKEYLHDEYCINSNQTIDFILPNISIPQQSYGTTDELEMSQYNQTKLPYHSNRGSICCIEIIDPRNNKKKLLVGISHKRTLPQKKPFRILPLMYMNNFYAMESYAPYNIVARTGRFCFEYPNKNEINFTYPRMSLNLQIGNERYNNCPSIQFITGMVEAIHDTNKVIISYGVDDCLSRFIIIDKQHIVTLLFNPSNMIY